MRLVRFESNGKVQIGVKVKEGVVPAGYMDMVAFIKDGDVAIKQAREAAKNGEPITNYRLLAPIAHPEKMLCSGINYANHKEENPKAKFPEMPSFFSKLPSSIR